MKTKFIEQFVFESAKYILKDQKISFALNVDYRNNKFTIDAKKSMISNKTYLEVQEIAKSLLKKKHGVNFAEKESSL